MKFLCVILIFLFCSSSTPWLSYSIRYVGTIQEKDKLLKELDNKNQEYRVFSIDSGMIYEVHYRSKNQP